MKLRRTFAIPLLMAVLAIGAFAGTASAHECVIASRSDTGNLAATHSDNWVNLGSIHDIYTFLSADAASFGLDPLSDAQIEWASQEAISQGIPGEVTVFTRFTLLEDTPAGSPDRMSNGKGIDHLENLFPKVIAIYLEALNH